MGNGKKEGKTVIVAEHRLYYLRGLVDRIIYMKAGRIEKEFGVEQIKALNTGELSDMGLRPLCLKDLAPKCDSKNKRKRQSYL